MIQLSDCCGAVNDGLHTWSVESVKVENGVFGAVAVDSKIFVEYETLVRQPLAEARRLAAFLDAQTDRSSADEQTVLAMAQAVNPAFWRNRYDRPLAGCAEATAEQQALYDFLRRKVVDPAAEFIEDCPMPPGWREFVHNAEAVVRSDP